MRNTVNGLDMPGDFATAAFERTHVRVSARFPASNFAGEHFISAWNAVAYRYVSFVEEGDAFTASIGSAAGGAKTGERYRQERALFGFFSSSFSAFEAFFYAMYAIGTALRPYDFPLATDTDRRRINPKKTETTYSNVFAGDPISAAFTAALNDSAYLECKDIRNILNHRTAPGRTVFATVGPSEQAPAAQWKLRGIPLDASLAQSRRAQISRVLNNLLNAAATFSESHF